MAQVGHSRLLKYLLPPDYVPEMAESIKVKFDYKDPENVTSDVPGQQKLREADPNNNIAKSTDSNVDTADNPKDFVFAPVVTITTNEATFTKGDMKLQKISVTENVSVSFQHLFKKQNLPGKTVVTKVEKIEYKVINNGVFYTIKTPTYPEIIGVAISETQTLRSTNKTEQNGIANMEESSTTNSEEKKRTKIPKLRFRQAASRVGKEKSELEGVESKSSTTPTPRRSSIPRLKTNRQQSTESKSETKENIKPEDEFEKIYDEIADHRSSIDETILNTKVEDPVKVDSRFEEIIHQYDENEIQPISLDKTKHSKIPMLKRKSEHDIEVPQSISKNVFRNKSFDEKSKVRDVISKFSKGNTEDGKPKQKLPVRTGIPKRLTNEIVSNTNEERLQNKEYKDGEKCEIKIENVEVTVSYEKVITSDDATITKTSLNESVVGTVISNPIEIVEVTPKIDVIYPNSINYEEIIEEKVSINDETVELVAAQQMEDVEIKIAKSNIQVDPVKVATFEDMENKIRQQNEKEALEINKRTGEQTTDSVAIDNKPVTNEDEDLILTSKYMNSLNRNLKDNQIDIEEDTPILRGKVSRIINRLDSRDTKDEPKNNINEITKPKSVLSKIAMFERQEPKYVLPPRDPTIPKCKPFPRRLEAKADEFISYKPKIVNGVLKTNLNENSKQNEENNNIYRPEIATAQIVNIEHFNSIASAVEEYVIPQDQTVVNKVKSETITFEESCIENESYTNDNKNSLTEPTNIEVEIKSAESYMVEYIQPINEKPIEIEAYVNQNSVHNGFINKINENPFKFPTIKVKDIDNSVEVPKSANRIRKYKSINEDDNQKRNLSVAEMDLGDNFKGKVHEMIVRMHSVEKLNSGKKEVISAKERPRTKSVLEKIALFEGRISHVSTQNITTASSKPTQQTPEDHGPSAEEYKAKVSELENAKLTHGSVKNMTYLVLDNGREMPVLAVGTALLDKNLTSLIVAAAIDLGYRAIDTAFIYGNEKEVGEGIKKKIDDGTVKREDLFIMSKLWSTCHRTDLVEGACQRSLQAMGLDYFDLYHIHNPMSFKEGADPLPRIANVLQYSDHDFLDAWFGMEDLVTKKLVRSIGLSNFNSSQVQKILEKARVKPVVNQVECHPYLSQQRLDQFCADRKVKLCCFGVLGSKGTPAAYKSSQTAVIDDPLVKVMAAGLNITTAQLLIRYQIQQGHSVVVKASTAAHLWDNLLALNTNLTSAQVDALSALNRNKRTFTFTGMGDTHKNYPFRAPF